MAKIFKPRRALRSSVKSGSKRTLVLASGELMLVGKSAIGEGSKADLYLGDGVSQMQNLTPAIYGDTSEEDITITDDTSTTASAALGNVTTGNTLGAILGSLKKAISLNAAAITTLNDESITCARIGATMQDNSYFSVVTNSLGKYGYGSFRYDANTNYIVLNETIPNNKYYSVPKPSNCKKIIFWGIQDWHNLGYIGTGGADNNNFNISFIYAIENYSCYVYTYSPSLSIENIVVKGLDFVYLYRRNS